MLFLLICLIFCSTFETQALIARQNLNVKQVKPKLIQTMPSLEVQNLRLVLSMLITRIQEVKKHEEEDQRRLFRLKYLRL